MGLNKVIYICEMLKGYSGLLPNGKVVDTPSWNWALHQVIEQLTKELK